MIGFETFVVVYLPYITILFFLAGMIYRLKAWSRLPQPSMTLFPRPAGGMKTGILAEICFFPKLFLSDKILWPLAWIFHLSLAMIALGHLRVLFDFSFIWNALGMTPADVDSMSATLGGIAGIVILVALIAIMLRRMVLQRVREISSGGDWIALLLIAAILATGNMMRFGEHFDLAQTRAWFLALITFSHVTVPAGAAFVWHIFLGQLLIIYIPYSKILHFGGVFFSQTALHRS
jgi:nitrate reductase gamma subunit